MILGILLCLLVFISLPKLGRWIRILFIRDEQSGWFLDAFIGTIVFVSLLLITSKMEVKPEWGALFLLPGWFFKTSLKGDLKILFAALLVLLVGGLSFWVQGALMSSNSTFPDLFFNVDSPFTLMLSQSFQANSGYPPALLENEGMRLMYHYGYHIFLAFISSFSGIKVHVVHSLILLPWMFFLKVGLIIGFLKKFTDIKLLWAGAFALVVWLGYQQYVFNYLNPNTLKNLIVLPNRYTALYPLGPSTFEGPFVLAALWLLLLKTNRSLALATVVIILVPLFKIPVAPVLGLGFGFALLHFAWYEKKINYLIYPVLTAVGMFVVFKLFSAAISVSPPIKLLSASHVQKDQWFSLLVPVLILVFLHFLNQKKILKNDNIWLFAFVLPMPMVLLFVNIQDVNTWQLIGIVPFVSWFLGAFLLIQNRSKILPIYKKALVVLSCFVLVIPLANAGIYVSNILRNPEVGHEYCDNTLLEKTLCQIPVKGSVLATNDLRYPAENFSRDGNQFQFSAIYGHQMKVSNLSYLITASFLHEAMAFQKKLPQSEPTKEDLDFLRSEGVTHFVLAISDSTLEGNPVKDYKIYTVSK